MPGEIGQKTLPIARPTDFLIEVAKGNVPGHSLVHILQQSERTSQFTLQFY